MQKWEYLTVTLSYSKEWKVSFMNGQEVPNWRNSQSYYVFLQKMGLDGWELISRIVSSTEGSGLGYSADNYVVTFKRPLN